MTLSRRASVAPSVHRFKDLLMPALFLSVLPFTAPRRCGENETVETNNRKRHFSNTTGGPTSIGVLPVSRSRWLDDRAGCPTLGKRFRLSPCSPSRISTTDPKPTRSRTIARTFRPLRNASLLVPSENRYTSHYSLIFSYRFLDLSDVTRLLYRSGERKKIVRSTNETKMRWYHRLHKYAMTLQRRLTAPERTQGSARPADVTRPSTVSLFYSIEERAVRSVGSFFSRTRSSRCSRGGGSGAPSRKGDGPRRL